MASCCFKQGCELEVQFVCQCSSSVTYSCEIHLEYHLKLPHRTHSFDSILVEPSEATKDVILQFLAKEKAKKEKLKKIANISFNQNLKTIENSNKSSLSDINSDLEEISCLIEKISQVSKNDPLNPQVLQYDNDIKEIMLPNKSEEYNKVALFCQLGQLRNKRSEILNKVNNHPETEQDFRRTCLLYENHASDSIINEVYQEYISGYQKIASTYLINHNDIYIYNSEIEKEEVKVLDISSYKPLTQLPNGELFLINPTNAYILDRNYEIRFLPRGAPRKCFGTIYFNRSIYCFGGDFSNSLNSSRKFDLDKNRWTKLTIMRIDMHGYFNSVVFNRNILISIDEYPNLLLYSIDIDSFSTISYNFTERKKIPINTGEKLYLIECKGWIYESEDEYNWKQISKSTIEITPEQVYCSYNKGGIYISILANNSRNYFKFDLSQNTIIDIAYYSINSCFQRSDDKLIMIKNYDKHSRLKPNNAAEYIDKFDKKYSLYFIGKKLENIEWLNEEIASYNGHGDKKNSIFAWNKKGKILCDLGMHLDAIECYNAAISIYPKYAVAYNNKGESLMSLGRYIEAIECFSEAIKLKHDFAIAYNNKGKALCNLNRNIEAIECYSEAIKLKIDEPIFYRNRASAFNKLERQMEALQDFNKADDLMKNQQAN